MSQTFDGRRILVVGGAGFVGSNLVRRLLATSDCRQVVVVDNLLSAEKENIPKDKRVLFHQDTITSERLLKKLPLDFDYIFHLATYHGNQNSMADPLADHANNTYTTLRLYEWALAQKHLKKLVYSSAGCTIAEKTFQKAKATTEEGPVGIAHDTPYQISKIIGEFYSVYYHKQKGLPVVRARFQNVYGPGEILGAGKWRGTSATVWRNVTPTFIYLSLKKRPLTVEGRGQATRDFIYVEDIARGLERCAVTVGTEGNVFNLASGQETSILDLAQMINRISGNPIPVAFKPLRSWDRSGRRFGSPQKAKKHLHFKTAIPIVEGLKRTIAWTSENLPFIEKTMLKHKTHFKTALTS